MNLSRFLLFLSILFPFLAPANASSTVDLSYQCTCISSVMPLDLVKSVPKSIIFRWWCDNSPPLQSAGASQGVRPSVDERAWCVTHVVNDAAAGSRKDCDKFVFKSSSTGHAHVGVLNRPGRAPTTPSPVRGGAGSVRTQAPCSATLTDFEHHRGKKRVS